MTATISPNNEIKVPVELLHQLNLKAGSPVRISCRDGRIEIEPENTLESLRGCLKGMDTTGYRDEVLR